MICPQIVDLRCFRIWAAPGIDSCIWAGDGLYGYVCRLPIQASFPTPADSAGFVKQDCQHLLIQQVLWSKIHNTCWVSWCCEACSDDWLMMFVLGFQDDAQIVPTPRGSSSHASRPLQLPYKATNDFFSGLGQLGNTPYISFKCQHHNNHLKSTHP